MGMAIIAALSGYSSTKLTVVVWVYAIARIIHMVLYYKIATDKNPSPRSIFWAIGFLTNLYLMIDLGIHLILWIISLGGIIIFNYKEKKWKNIYLHLF